MDNNMISHVMERLVQHECFSQHTNNGITKCKLKMKLTTDSYLSFGGDYIATRYYNLCSFTLATRTFLMFLSTTAIKSSNDKKYF